MVTERSFTRHVGTFGLILLFLLKTAVYKHPYCIDKRLVYSFMSKSRFSLSMTNDAKNAHGTYGLVQCEAQLFFFNGRITADTTFTQEVEPY